MDKHIFWLGLTMIVLGWYMFICVYVGIKGGMDIRQMIKRLGEKMRKAQDG